MASFNFQFEASAIFSVDSPTLEVLVDGVVVSSSLIGSGLSAYEFSLDYTGNFPTSLSLRFNDGSAEGGRSISLGAVKVNGWTVDPSYIGALSLLQSQSSAINTGATDHLYGRVVPVTADVGTPTQTGTTGDDRITVPATPPAPGEPDIVDAGNGNDRVVGSDNGNATFGGAGNDTLFGGAGNDMLVGGLGDDTLTGNAGDDILHGEDGADTLQGGAGNDMLNGGTGNDSLNGGDGNDILYGEDGDDTILGGAGNDRIYGDAGNDTISAGAGDDIVYGGLGDDRIFGDAGNDTLYGEAGNDIIQGALGDDTIYGNGGMDDILGGAGNDTISGGDDADTVNGDAGNDTISGDAGNDTLLGAAGADTLNGGTGDDILFGHALDSIAIATLLRNNPTVSYNKGTGNFYQLVAGPADFATALAAAPVISGVAGHLVTITSAAENTFVQNLAAGATIWLGGGDTATEGAWVWSAGPESGLQFWSGTAGGSAQNNFYTNWLAGQPSAGAANEDGATMNAGGFWSDTAITGTYAYVIEWEGWQFSDDNLADTLNGGDNNDVLYGAGGNDVLNGDAGADKIWGGAGNDTISGGAGNDTLNGDSGTDTADYSAAANGVTLSLMTGTASNDGDGGSDTLTAIENVTGSAFNDNLTGDDNSNAIDGGGGNDVINGGNGNDTLAGGTGADLLTYRSAASAVTVNLGTVTAQNTIGAGVDTLSGFENLTGSDYDDTLTGDAGSNVLTGGNGSDTISGAGGNDTLYAVAQAVTLFSTNFNATTESFSYADDVFGGAGGAYVTGSRNTGDGVGGNGSLEVLFDGTNATVSATMSGGWTHGFTTTEAIENTVLSFDYKVVREGTYETNEDSYVYVMLNGTYYGINSNDYVTHFESDGNDPQYDTGWVHISINFGTLLAGTHSLTVGGMVEGKNAADEDTTIRFDNIIVVSDVGTDDGEANVLDGGDDDDILYGSAGADTLNGGAGSDTINSGSVLSVTTADVLAAYAGVVYNATTNSFYQFVNSSVTWQAAQTAATSSLIFGTAGHLAHSNSAIENAYLDSISGANSIHMGGSDGLVNGEWRWVGGAADGVQFWQGLAGGNSVGGAYTNWAAGEPNDYNNYESRLMMYNGGTWNDQLEGTGARYVIEWEANQILVTGNTTTINAGAGNDTVNGGAGSDIVDGGDGDDILYGGGGTDSLYGGNGNDEIHSGAVSVLSQVTIFTASFGSGNDSFTYSDGGFGGTDPANSDVAGTRNTGDGDAANGALQVYIDGQNGLASANISGAWSRTVNLADNANSVQLGLSYRHWHNSSNDAGEDSRVYVEVDGVRYGVGANDYISQALGSGGTTDTGWVQIVLDLGSLVAGNHTITMGIFQTAENGSTEDSYVRFDDISLSYSLPSGLVTTLSGQDGLDTLYGGAGIDYFVFEAASAFNNIDKVYNYDTADLDRLDIRDLLSGYVAGTSDDDLFARFVVSGADLLLQVDANGAAGGSSYTSVAQLMGLGGSGLNIEEMVANGFLVMT